MVNRIYKDGDCKVNLQEFKEIIDTSNYVYAKFFTTSQAVAIEKSNIDYNYDIFLNWDELRNLGKGVLQYILYYGDSQLNENSFDKTDIRTTNYYVVSDISIEGETASNVDVVLAEQVQENINEVNAKVANVYTKEETYSKDEVNNLITDSGGFVADDYYNKESINEIVNEKVNTDSVNETEIKDISKFDSYSDSDGYIVAKIGDITDIGKGIQSVDYFDSNGNSITEEITNLDERITDIEENSGVSGNCLPLDSNTEEIVSDNSNSEIWCDNMGYVGMKLENGILKVKQIEGKLIDGVLENEFVLPKYVYCLNGVQRNFWHQSILKRWNPYDYYLQFGGSAKYQRRTPLVATVKEGNTDGKSITISLIDNRKMETIQTDSSLLRVATPKQENDGLQRIKVSFIGSSTTQSTYFKEAFSRYVSNYELIGIRHKPNDANMKHEGRGGSTLANHFGEGNGISESPLKHYFPFWQPNDVSENETHRYWGATGFWVLAHTHPDNESQSDDENGAYENGCYVQEALDKFDSTTGLLINPSKGDIMYNTDNSEYIEHNGSQWITTARNNYNWSFQYKKYLEMWGLETPDVVSICLGTNEFKNVAVANMETEIARWNVLMETLINDIHTNVDSNIKIVLCNQGHFSNYGKDGIPTAVWNYKMWLHLKDLVKVFDSRENENIYVLAQGSEISAEYGFPTIMTGKNKYPTASPYSDTVAVTYPWTDWSVVFPTELYHELYNNNDYPYTEDNKTYHASVQEQKMNVLNQDVVHSTLSYPNQGVPMAAFCQYIRQH